MSAPGLFDFQVNGFAGIDFQRDDLSVPEMSAVTEALRSHGVGSIFATLVTAPIENLSRRFAALEKARAARREIAAMIAGYHLEGPWISPEDGYRGAHPRDPIHAPSLAEFERLQQAAGGRIRLVTLAPEWPTAPEFIAELTRRGVHVSLGHTNASEEDIDGAIAAGARFVTHLGNGTPLQMHRHDNVVQRLLSRDELIACLIPDGIHLPPFVLRNFYRAKPRGRVLFTTDCMAAAGAPPGRYTINQHTVEVGADGVVRDPSSGLFAGSSLSPDDGVRRIAGYLRLSEPEAVRLWSDTPRMAFGVEPPFPS